jgi:hypothetical protein
MMLTMPVRKVPLKRLVLWLLLFIILLLLESSHVKRRRSSRESRPSTRLLRDFEADFDETNYPSRSRHLPPSQDRFEPSSDDPGAQHVFFPCEHFKYFYFFIF